MYYWIVEIRKDFLFDPCVNVFIRVLLVVWSNTLIEWVLFSETVERSSLLRACAIKNALNRYDASKGVVLHVI